MGYAEEFVGFDSHEDDHFSVETARLDVRKQTSARAEGRGGFSGD